MRMRICPLSPMKKLSRSALYRSIRLSATPLATLLFTAAIPSTPALAVHDNDYQLCTSQLLRANIAPAVVAESCADALYPRDLTICVYQINQRTNIAPTNALETCRQVRRPRDLATCVVDISNHTQGASANEVLRNCRLSLLPRRYAECVVGLYREIDASAAQAMDTCISASERTRAFYPPIPVPEGSPLLQSTPITPVVPIKPPPIVPVPAAPNFR